MKPKKILLLDPPFQKFMNFSKNGIPTGLVSIAGSLISKGHEVRVLDADYNPHGVSYPLLEKMEHYQMYLDGLHDDNHPIWKHVVEQVVDLNPDVVGMTMLSSKVESGFRVAKLLKKMGISRVVAGGPHVTLDPEYVLANPHIDAVLVGEGELHFEELFEQSFVRAERIHDLDSLPLPRRDALIGLEEYRPNDLSAIMTGRGCPNSCSFCSSNALWGRGVRNRGLENVFREIDEVASRYGSDDFYVMDDTFTLHRQRVLDFGEGMKERNLKWSCLTRADRVDEELITHMKNSGCRLVKIGVESGNERILRTMNKRVSLERMQQTADTINKVGLPWLAYFIIASPEETTEEMWDTWRFIEKIRPTYISVSVYTNSPGSPFSQKYHYDEKFDLSEANYHSLRVTAGKIPLEEMRRFVDHADIYNSESNRRKLENATVK